MKKLKIPNSLGSLVSLLLFAAALWVLHRELKTYHFSDILRNLREIPSRRLLAAVGLTVLSYFTLTGYDMLAVRYIRRPLSYAKIVFTSFIAYAFSNNMGLSMVSGGSVRYRLYSTWGLSALEITKVVGFCLLTTWLGVITLGGSVLLLDPAVLPQVLHLPRGLAYPLGGVLITLTTAYVLMSALRRKPVRIRDWEFYLPSPGVSLPQIAFGIMDWAVASSVLYAILPAVPNLSYPHFLGIFLLGQTAGLLSQVPAGLGVFESVILLLLTPTVSASDVLGMLLAYRAIYYLLPLATATIMIGSHEILHEKGMVRRLSSALGEQVSWLAPHVLAVTTFVGGAILLFFGAIPTIGWRLLRIKAFIPLPVFEISHFLASLIGMALLLLARGLQLRLDAAYLITVGLLGAGIVFSLLEGLYYEAAIALAVILGALLPSRRHFYRKASVLSQPFTAGWIAAIIIAFSGSIWLGIFSHKHLEYSGALWWRFTFSGSAPRFLRASVGAIGLAMFFAMARLLRAGKPKFKLPDQAELEKARAVVQATPNCDANLALLGDKTFLWSQSGGAFIMYAIEGRSWVALGNPVGPEQEMSELVWRFRELCDRYHGWSVFYQVGVEHLPLYLDLGLAILKLGEEARVRLETFSLEGSSRKRMRHIKNKFENEGFSFEVVPAEGVPSLLPELRGISDAWLAGKNTREKGFSLGFFKEDYLKFFPAGVVRSNDRIFAFANIWRGAGKEELSIDLMRYLPEAPPDVMEYLFIQLMLWGREEGYRWFNLGMAPLSGLEYRSFAPLWNKLGAIIFRHGEHFYNLQGLRSYKEKFDPEWRPKYLASTGGMALPRILANVATLISGGLKGTVAK